MAHCLDTVVVVETLFGDVPGRYWTNGEQMTYASRQGKDIMIITGPNREVVDLVRSQFLEG